MKTESSYKYYAFISYNSHDTAWGKRLQRKLETYRMPATLCNERGWKREPMKPVFFAPTDIQPGGLTAELQERLKASRHLIVICSPNSARSEWVGKEIAYFHSLGRAERIHFFIVDGVPHSGNKETECFNPVVKELGLPEILGANIHEKIYKWPWMNRERAYVQLITKLLGVEFDSIWQRHKRLMKKKIIAWLMSLMAIMAALIYVWIINQPMNVNVQLEEMSVHNEQLPPLRNAIVTIELDNEIKTDTIATLDSNAIFTNVPHRFLNKEVSVTVDCKDFHRVDTTLLLSDDMQLCVYRDADVYGKIRFRLWNPDAEKAVTDTEIQIDGHKTFSDKEGVVSLFIPLEAQRQSYHVNADIPLLSDTIYMPCGINDVVLINKKYLSSIKSNMRECDSASQNIENE